MTMLSNNLSAQEQKNCCSTSFTQDSIKYVSLKVLSSEYRRLKRKPCEDCFDWARSGLQLVMIELGERLEGKSKSDIRKVMGKPTDIDEGQWIYDWRDGHDYLFFEFTNDRAKADWYHAYE